MQEHHETSGQRNVKFQAWRKDENGLCRTITFVNPKKGVQPVDAECVQARGRPQHTTLPWTAVSRLVCPCVQQLVNLYGLSLEPGTSMKVFGALVANAHRSRLPAVCLQSCLFVYHTACTAHAAFRHQA